MVHCCFTSTETIRIIRTESPGRKAQDGHLDFHIAPAGTVKTLAVVAERYILTTSSVSQAAGTSVVTPQVNILTDSDYFDAHIL